MYNFGLNNDAVAMPAPISMGNNYYMMNNFPSHHIQQYNRNHPAFFSHNNTTTSPNQSRPVIPVNNQDSGYYKMYSEMYLGKENMPQNDFNPLNTTSPQNQPSISPSNNDINQSIQPQYTPAFSSADTIVSKLKNTPHQQNHPISPSQTTLPNLPEALTPSFVTNAQDILSSINTILLPDRYSNLSRKISSAERVVARLMLQYGSKFKMYLPDETRNAIIKAAPESKLALLLQQSQIRPQVLLYESKSAEVSWEYLSDLAPGKWLSMHLINGFFSLLMKRQERLKEKYTNFDILTFNSSPSLSQKNASISPSQKNTSISSDSPFPSMISMTFPNFYALSTQFFTQHQDPRTKCLKYDYSRVKRWSSRAKIVINDLDYLFLPCHINGNHWTLLVADIKNRLICYYDSFGHDDDGRGQILAEYLYDEWITYGGWNGFRESDQSYARNVTNTSGTTTSHNSTTMTDRNNPFLSSLDTISSEYRHPDRVGMIITTGNEKKQYYPDVNFKQRQEKALGNTSRSSRPSNIALDSELNWNPFRIGSTPKITKQTNVYDCGVFVCSFANALTLGINAHGVSLAEYNNQLDMIHDDYSQSFHKNVAKIGNNNTFAPKIDFNQFNNIKCEVESTATTMVDEDIDFEIVEDYNAPAPQQQQQQQSSSQPHPPPTPTETPYLSPNPPIAYTQAELITRLDHSKGGVGSQEGMLLPFLQGDHIDFRHMIAIAFVNNELPVL